jgi:Methyltransferase domain
LTRAELAAAWAATAGARTQAWPRLIGGLAASDDMDLVPDRSHPLWVELGHGAINAVGPARANDPALALLSRIRRGPLPELAVDRLLRSTRDRLVELCADGQLPGGWLLLATALVQHCEIAGYLWPEPEHFDALPDDRAGDLLWLCVRPPPTLTDTRYQRFRADDDPFTAPLRSRLIDFPAHEAEIAARLPVMGEIAGEHLAIAALYEARPYPRGWRVPRLRPTDLRAYVLAQHPRLVDQLPNYPDRPQILAAGCGTGRQPISLALALPGCDVLGVDLSRASLAHASRRATVAGASNLSLAQADLTTMTAPEAMAGGFDHIECTGVLHHLNDPDSGWAALSGLASPGATLRVAVYSERGRADVVAARALADTLNLRGHDMATLRALRKALEQLPDADPARGVLSRIDAYTAPGLADLVLNPCEHRYGPLDLGAALRTAGLEFLGIEFAAPHHYAQILHSWRARWPDDPRMLDWEHWEAWEEEHPESFANMFTLWARRSA